MALQLLGRAMVSALPPTLCVMVLQVLFDPVGNLDWWLAWVVDGQLAWILLTSLMVFEHRWVRHWEDHHSHGAVLGMRTLVHGGAALVVGLVSGGVMVLLGFRWPWFADVGRWPLFVLGTLGLVGAWTWTTMVGAFLGRGSLAGLVAGRYRQPVAELGTVMAVLVVPPRLAAGVRGMAGARGRGGAAAKGSNGAGSATEAEVGGHGTTALSLPPRGEAPGSLGLDDQEPELSWLGLLGTIAADIHQIADTCGARVLDFGDGRALLAWKAPAPAHDMVACAARLRHAAEGWHLAAPAGPGDGGPGQTGAEEAALARTTAAGTAGAAGSGTDAGQARVLGEVSDHPTMVPMQDGPAGPDLEVPDSPAPPLRHAALQAMSDLAAETAALVAVAEAGQGPREAAGRDRLGRVQGQDGVKEAATGTGHGRSDQAGAGQTSLTGLGYASPGGAKGTTSGPVQAGAGHAGASQAGTNQVHRPRGARATAAATTTVHLGLHRATLYQTELSAGRRQVLATGPAIRGAWRLAEAARKTAETLLVSGEWLEAKPRNDAQLWKKIGTLPAHGDDPALTAHAHRLGRLEA